jgi:ATP-dependent helicase/nuclease subunit B
MRSGAGSWGIAQRPPSIAYGRHMGDVRQLLVTGFGPLATAALGSMLSDLRRDDPLRPVDVVVPSALSGVTVRRTLADPALANVRFGSLPQLAERLARRQMALDGQRALTEPARVLAARQALGQDSGRLAEAAAHPATAAMVTEALAELDEVEAESHLDALAATGARGAEVSRLYAAYRSAHADLLTGAEIARVAASAVRSGTAPETTVVLFAPHRLSPAERDLLTALAGEGRLRCVIATASDDSVAAEDQTLIRWADDLLGPAVTQEGQAVEEVTLSWAPDAEEEVREAVRTILAHLVEHPVRPERIAVAYRSTAPYARLLDEQLTVAGLPFHVSGGRRLTDSVPGRTLLRLLELKQHEYARSEVLAWLADAPVLTPTGQPVPVARWERISRSAGVSRGLGVWRSHLGQHTTGVVERRDKLDANAMDAHELDARRANFDRRIDDAEALGAFVDELAESCERVASAKTWADVAASMTDAVTRFLGRPSVADRWMVEDDAVRWRKVERGAYDAVLAAVDRLALLGEVDAPSYDMVLTALRRELDTALPSGTTVGRGIAVTPIRDLVGADLDLLVVVGMTEDSFPPRIREHPVLGDQARRVVGLPTTKDRRLAERRHYLAARASARRVVLSAPKADTRAQRALQPSPWFMGAVAELNGGESVASRDLPSLKQTWFVRHDSFEQALRGSASLASVTELGIQLALEGRSDVLADEDPHYARSRAAVRSRTEGGSRTESGFDEWTGHVDALRDEVRRRVDTGLSASSLQTFATCPRSFWLDRVLGVMELEDPGEDDVMDARRKGTLVHEVLERLLAESLPADGTPRRLGRAPEHAWTLEEISDAHALLEEESALLEAQGVTGRPLLWKAHKARLRRQLTRILQVDSRKRAERRATPIALEAAFGRRDERTDRDVPPLVLDLPRSGEVALAGFIDRVDRAADGTVIVTDYKTGKGYGYERIPAVGAKLPDDPDMVDRGRKLQLVLYGLAARRDFGHDTAPVEAYYWFVEQGELHRGGPVDPTAEQRLLDVVDISVHGIRSGVYPARPGDEDWRGGWENCTFCPYDRVCPTTRAEQWEVVRHDPHVEAYAHVADPPPTVDGDTPEEVEQ